MVFRNLPTSLKTCDFHYPTKILEKGWRTDNESQGETKIKIKIVKMKVLSSLLLIPFVLFTNVLTDNEIGDLPPPCKR